MTVQPPSSRRSLRRLVVCALVLLMGLPLGAQAAEYIHFLWNQHQPTYENAVTGKFEFSFTRLHAMSSYYFMAAVLMDGRNDINTYAIQDNRWVDTGQPTGQGFPFVHISINLSGVLLEQIQHYVDKLSPAFDQATTIDEIDLTRYPVLDPRDPSWQDGTALLEMGIDLMCKPVANWSIYDKRWILDNTVYLKPSSNYTELWPSYKALWTKRNEPGGGNPAHWTDEELGDLIMWWNLAVMHPFFKETNDYILRGHDKDGREMTDHVTRIKALGQFKTWGDASESWFGEAGETLVPSDMGGYSGGSGAEFTQDGRTCRHFTDQDRLHLAWQQFKVLKYIIPVHRKMQDTITPDGFGQLEVTTTPFSHPILPLIYDTDLWMERMGYYDRVDAVNFAFHGDGPTAAGPYGPGSPVVFNDDVYNQVALGCKIYKDSFGRFPHGMWPGEGSVGEKVIYAFRRNGVKWISSGNETGDNSGHHDDNGRMYRIDEDGAFLDGDNSDGMSICFRSERDLVGFDGGYYNGGWGADADAKASFIMENHVRTDWGHEKFWTHTADGENPWGWFHRLGTTFLESTTIEGGVKSYGLYYRLNRAHPMIPDALRWYKEQQIYAAHPSMYIGIKDGQYSGDGKEGLDAQYELEPLSHGSWIYGNFDTWMGEENEIQGWYHLKKTRDDFQLAGLEAVRPDPYAPEPDPKLDRKKYLIWQAWHEIYHAESSDYFWWYGADQCFGSDEIFDNLFRKRLCNAYLLARQAGFPVAYPVMQRHQIIDPEDNVNNHHWNGAADDEDYKWDCEPPPGHGDFISIPPITQDPSLTPSSIAADGRSRAIIRVRVFEEGYETSHITSVTVDTRSIGGQKAHPLFDSGNLVLHGDAKGGDGWYSAYVTVAAGTPDGDYLLTISAIDDGANTGVLRDPIESRDFVTLTVLPGADPSIGMGGYMLSDLDHTRGGTLALHATLVHGPERGRATVSVYYQGIPLGIDLTQDTGNDLPAFEFNTPIGPTTPGSWTLELVGSTAAGQVTNIWPYLTVAP